MSVEWGIITSVVPPGGFHYPQTLASGDTVRITGYSFEQLFESMLEFRLRHIDLCGAETANMETVRADLRDYLCSHFPQNCAGSRTAPATVSGGIAVSNYVTPINKAGDWLAMIANRQMEYVDPALAAQRAQICASCPQNVRWQTPCGPCNDNISVRIQNAKGSMATPYDRNLMVCRIFGHENSVAVWLKDTMSDSGQQAPQACWLVQEKQNRG